MRKPKLRIYGSGMRNRNWVFKMQERAEVAYLLCFSIGRAANRCGDRNVSGRSFFNFLFHFLAVAALVEYGAEDARAYSIWWRSLDFAASIRGEKDSLQCTRNTTIFLE